MYIFNFSIDKYYVAKKKTHGISESSSWINMVFFCPLCCCYSSVPCVCPLVFSLLEKPPQFLGISFVCVFPQCFSLFMFSVFRLSLPLSPGFSVSLITVSLVRSPVSSVFLSPSFPPGSWPFSGFYKARECHAVVTAGLVTTCSEG